jgi:hypothetical protein
VTTIAERLAGVRARIAAAAARAGRSTADVQIVAAAKTQPPEAIAAALAAGVDAIGENRVQEALAKRSAAGGDRPWHLIGPLQRNKARHALDAFDVIETVDRVELADRLETLLAGSPRVVPVFLEVNVGGEAQKSGIAPGDAAALADHLIDRCPHLRLVGLMTVPPWHPDPERSRPHFTALRALAERLAGARSLPALELSMGMSEDFEVAVEEGATLVRLGRVLFGERRPG